MFTFDQKILFKHCDPAGIVFYPRYFEIINDCVEAFFDSIGHPLETLLKTGGIPTAEISTRFKAPSRHGDHLNLALNVAKIGNASLNLYISAKAGDQDRFTSTSTIVHVSPKGRATRWPDDIRTSLTNHLRSSQ